MRNHLIGFGLVTVLVSGFLSGCSAVKVLTPMTDGERANQVVSSAQATVQSFLRSNDKPLQKFRELLPTAKAVVILPGLIKGGFIVGAEGGNGVLLAKGPDGSWSHPAFYILAAGSIGLQIGAQTTDVALLVFNDKALTSIIEHQGKFGADLGLIVGTIGVGVEASTTTNVGADILAFSHGVGVFAGGSLEAAALIKRNDLNAVFYGRSVTPGEIIYQRTVQNSAADGLRAALNGR